MSDIRPVAVTVPAAVTGAFEGSVGTPRGARLVGGLPTRTRLHQRRCGPAQLVVLGLAEGENHASAALPLLALLPSARILVLAYSGRHAWVHGH